MASRVRAKHMGFAHSTVGMVHLGSGGLMYMVSKGRGGEAGAVLAWMLGLH